jgi:hypothetical protein
MGVLRSSELGEFLCYSPEHFPAGAGVAGKFWGYRGLTVPSGRSNSRAGRTVEAATVFAQVRATIGSLGLLSWAASGARFETATSRS